MRPGCETTFNSGGLEERPAQGFVQSYGHPASLIKSITCYLFNKIPAAATLQNERKSALPLNPFMAPFVKRDRFKKNEDPSGKK
jgi:hypothetical protein